MERELGAANAEWPLIRILEKGNTPFCLFKMLAWWFLIGLVALIAVVYGGLLHYWWLIMLAVLAIGTLWMMFNL